MRISKLIRASAKAQSAPAAGNVNLINDRRFIAQLEEVQNLKRFLFEEKVKFKKNQIDSIDLGSLSNLRLGSRGRTPTPDEWKLVDKKMAVLASYLNGDLTQKIRLRELDVYFGVIPLSFLLASLILLMYRFLYGGLFVKDSLAFNISYLVSSFGWTVAQGGLGACAFLGTRAATKRVKKEPLEKFADTTDISDSSILKIRIILGCLFGSLIGLPLVTLTLEKMADALYPSGDKGTLEFSDFALMILPFMVGFSTNLVLAILERSIDSIRTFFGLGGK